MKMNELLETMKEATRLTQEGNAPAATDAIQRTLQKSLEATLAADATTLIQPSPLSPRANGTAPGRFLPELFTGLGIASSVDGSMPGVDALSPQPQRKTEFDEAEGGQFLSASHSNHAGTRDYKLYIPSRYHGQPLPLVVMLHGCTQDPDDFAAGTRMNALAEETQCFIAYPEQTQSANASRCWNWFNSEDQQRGQGEPSIIAGITQDIIGNYNVDTRRVYIAGLSAGGAMAMIMGTTYPDLYAAVGIQSGLPYAAANDLPSALAAMQKGTPISAQPADTVTALAQIPVIVFHGDRDSTVHPSNGDQIIAQAKANARASVLQAAVSDGHTYTRNVYRDGAGQAIAEQWIVHGAGHAWSGGSADGSYTDGKGPDASREMMRFFSTNPKPAG